MAQCGAHMVYPDAPCRRVSLPLGRSVTCRAHIPCSGLLLECGPLILTTEELRLTGDPSIQHHYIKQYYSLLILQRYQGFLPIFLSLDISFRTRLMAVYGFLVQPSYLATRLPGYLKATAGHGAKIPIWGYMESSPRYRRRLVHTKLSSCQLVGCWTTFPNINLIHFLIYWRDNFLLLNLIKLKQQAHLNSLVCNSPELEDVSLFGQSYLNSYSPRSILLVGAF